MFKSRASTEAKCLASAGKLRLLEFEIALDLGYAGGLFLEDAVRQAVDRVGAEFLLALPSLDGVADAALVRMPQDCGGHIVQVSTANSGFAIADEARIDAALLRFAHSSIAVMERLRDDARLREPWLAQPR